MTKSNSPRRGDSLELGDPIRPFGESTTEWLLSQALNSMHATNDEGRYTYSQAVAVLRERSGELLAVLRQIEDRLPAGSHMVEWSLHYVLAELEDPALISKFVATAVRKVAERNPDIRGCQGPEDLAVLVQVMAVEALERLVARDKQLAIQALFEVVEAQPHLAVRRPAVQAVLRSDPTQTEKLRELLPEGQRFVLDLKRVPLQDLNAPINPAEFRPRPDRPGAAPRLAEHRTSPSL
jgi:hypothetical protein